MKTEKFKTLVDNRLEYIDSLLVNKSKEYTIDEDRLHNFNEASRITGESREKVLWGMALKHLVSIQDIVFEMNKDEKYIPSEFLVQEKISDMMAYLILLEASIEDKRDKQPLPF